jgi:antitoxin VapB
LLSNGGSRRKQKKRNLGTVALRVKDPETQRLARILAERTGETLTEATRRALEERLRRLGQATRKPALLDDLRAIRRRWSAIPVLDRRSAEEIIGYDENGAPR